MLKRLLLGALVVPAVLFPAAAGHSATRELGTLHEDGWLVIEKRDILASGAVTLVDVLAGVPGLIVNSTGSPTGLATISLRGAPARQVLVTLDGAPLNQPTNGVADLSAVPLGLVERIEINRSTAGVLTGGGSVGGVVNIVTTGSGSLLSVGVGTAGGQRHTVSLSPGLSALRLQAWLESHDGRRPNSDGERLGARLSAALEGDAYALRLSYALRSAELGVPGPRPAAGQPPLFGDEEVSSLRDRQKELEHTVALNGRLYLGPAGLWLTARWSDSDLDFTSWYDFFGAYRDASSYATRSLFVELGGSLTPTESLGLALVLDYAHDELRARTDSTFWAEDDLDDEGETTTTVWSPTSSRFGARLKAQGLFVGWGVSADLRLDVPEGGGLELTPGVLARLELDALQLTASGGMTYAAPNLNDLHWPGAGNPDLKPERGWQVDLNAVLAPGLSRTEATAFYRVTRDLIAWMPGDDGWWRPTNVNEQEVLGLTVETAFNLGENLHPRLSYTYTDATQRNSELVYSDWLEGDTFDVVERRAAYLPRHQAALALPVSLGPDSGVIFNLRWTGVQVAYYPDYSDYPVIGMREKRLPAALTLDLRAQYRLDGALTIFCSLENLTGEDSPIAFGDSYDDGDYPRPPRGLTVGAELLL